MAAIYIQTIGTYEKAYVLLVQLAVESESLILDVKGHFMWWLLSVEGLRMLLQNERIPKWDKIFDFTKHRASWAETERKALRWEKAAKLKDDLFWNSQQETASSGKKKEEEKKNLQIIAPIVKPLQPSRLPAATGHGLKVNLRTVRYKTLCLANSG